LLPLNPIVSEVSST